jgi:hypothetical protein
VMVLSAGDWGSFVSSFIVIAMFAFGVLWTYWLSHMSKASARSC